MPYKLVVFDWDGTLIDSQASIVQSMSEAYKSLAMAPPDKSAIRQIIGLSLDRAISTLSPEADQTLIIKIGEAYRDVFYKRNYVQPDLFEDALGVLRDLKLSGCYLAVATGKSRRGLDADLNRFELNDYFDITRCSDETLSKPNPLMLDEILTDLNMSVEHAVMIGDTSYDISMANAINMDSIAVTYGMHTIEELSASKPTQMIDNIKQLTQLITG